MSKIKYDLNLMKFISLFESLTHAGVKDCIDNGEQLIFIVNENDVGKAVGKNGANVKRISSMLNKPIKVVEFSPDVLQFVRNFVHPLQIKDVKEENGVVLVEGVDTKTKGQIIGRDRKNLDNLTNVVKRHFSIDEIKVV